MRKAIRVYCRRSLSFYVKSWFLVLSLFAFCYIDKGNWKSDENFCDNRFFGVTSVRICFFFFAKSRGAGGFFEKKIKCLLREAIDLESERVRKLFFSVGCIWILVRSEDHKIWPK